MTYQTCINQIGNVLQLPLLPIQVPPIDIYSVYESFLAVFRQGPDD